MFPFNALTNAIANGDPCIAWDKACNVATKAAEDTLASTKIGAHDAWNRSVGTPDAGAISFSKAMVVIRDFLQQN